MENHVVLWKGYMHMYRLCASLRFWPYGHSIRTTTNYIVDPACLRVRGEREIHTYFSQSTVRIQWLWSLFTIK